MDQIISFFSENPASTVKECIAALAGAADEKTVRKAVMEATKAGTLAVVGKRAQVDAEGNPSRGRPSNLLSAVGRL